MPTRTGDRAKEFPATLPSQATFRIIVPHRRAIVRRAILDFAARRGLSIEDTGLLSKGNRLRNKDWPSHGMIEIRYKAPPRSADGNRPSGTIVELTSLGDESVCEAVHLLHRHLEIPAAFERITASECPKCSKPVKRAAAHYCGLCGANLIAAESQELDAPSPI